MSACEADPEDAAVVGGFEFADCLADGVPDFASGQVGCEGVVVCHASSRPLVFLMLSSARMVFAACRMSWSDSARTFLSPW